jgi:hypothetical protein
MLSDQPGDDAATSANAKAQACEGTHQIWGLAHELILAIECAYGRQQKQYNRNTAAESAHLPASHARPLLQQ